MRQLRWVYHHHWRGLDESELKLSDEQLLKTGHSVHGDFRLERDARTLWGFTVFLGTTEANRKAGGDRLIHLPPNDNLQITFKLWQPHAWLDVGKKAPYISEPGQVGATANKYSKFFALDSGTYEIGVWREHMFELFIHGHELKGRYLLMYAPVSGKNRVWLIDHPVDQKPYADTHNIEDVVNELRAKGQRYLVWSDGRSLPRLYEL